MPPFSMKQHDLFKYLELCKPIQDPWCAINGPTPSQDKRACVIMPAPPCFTVFTVHRAWIQSLEVVWKTVCSSNSVLVYLKTKQHNYWSIKKTGVAQSGVRRLAGSQEMKWENRGMADGRERPPPQSPEIWGATLPEGLLAWLVCAFLWWFVRMCLIVVYFISGCWFQHHFIRPVCGLRWSRVLGLQTDSAHDRSSLSPPTQARSATHQANGCFSWF